MKMARLDWAETFRISVTKYSGANRSWQERAGTANLKSICDFMGTISIKVHREEMKPVQSSLVQKGSAQLLILKQEWTEWKIVYMYFVQFLTYALTSHTL